MSHQPSPPSSASASTDITVPSPSAPDHPGHPPNESTTNNDSDDEILSDLPSLRRQHMTTGYREGLSMGKAAVMQSAFDCGFPIGVSIALRVGRILGVLEGIITAFNKALERQEGRLGQSGRKGDGTEDCERDGEGSVEGMKSRLEEVRKVYERAERELDVKELLRGVGDDVVAGAEGVSGLGSVEAVLRRWEDFVFENSGGGDGDGDGNGGEEKG